MPGRRPSTPSASLDSAFLNDTKDGPRARTVPASHMIGDATGCLGVKVQDAPRWFQVFISDEDFERRHSVHRDRARIPHETSNSCSLQFALPEVGECLTRRLPQQHQLVRLRRLIIVFEDLLPEPAEWIHMRPDPRGPYRVSEVLGTRIAPRSSPLNGQRRDGRSAYSFGLRARGFAAVARGLAAARGFAAVFAVVRRARFGGASCSAWGAPMRLRRCISRDL